MSVEEDVEKKYNNLVTNSEGSMWQLERKIFNLSRLYMSSSSNVE